MPPTRRGQRQNVIAELARQSDEDDSAYLMAMRQEVLDHLQYLDSFSYNNVFVGEERRVLGTKIDYDTPRAGKCGARGGQVQIPARACTLTSAPGHGNARGCAGTRPEPIARRANGACGCGRDDRMPNPEIRATETSRDHPFEAPRWYPRRPVPS